MKKIIELYFKYFILIILVAAIGVYGVKYYQLKTITKKAEVPTSVVPEVVIRDLDTGTLEDQRKKQAGIQETSIKSPNADKELILRVNPIADGMTEYTYITAIASGEKRYLLYSTTLPSGESTALSADSWDPTGTYVFLEVQKSDSVDFLVFEASGSLFPDESIWIDMGNEWMNKNIENKLATGAKWLSGTQLVVKTTKEDGTVGPSYSFDISSGAIQQLAP